MSISPAVQCRITSRHNIYVVLLAVAICVIQGGFFVAVQFIDEPITVEGIISVLGITTLSVVLAVTIVLPHTVALEFGDQLDIVYLLGRQIVPLNEIAAIKWRGSHNVVEQALLSLKVLSECWRLAATGLIQTC